MDQERLRGVRAQKLTRRVAAATLLVAVCAAGRAHAAPGRLPERSAFRLFATFYAEAAVNRVYCAMLNYGETCVNVVASPNVGGGDWPKYSGSHYIFNSGLQLAALLPAAAGFPWSGDTVGVWFMDPRGDQQSGSPVTAFFDSRRDLAA